MSHHACNKAGALQVKFHGHLLNYNFQLLSGQDLSAVWVKTMHKWRGKLACCLLAFFFLVMYVCPQFSCNKNTLI